MEMTALKFIMQEHESVETMMMDQQIQKMTKVNSKKKEMRSKRNIELRRKKKKRIKKFAKNTMRMLNF